MENNLSAAEPRTIAPHSQNTSAVSKRKATISKMLTATAEAMMTEISHETLTLWSADLAFLVPQDETIAQALRRIRREIKGRDGFKATWTLADILERCGIVAGATAEDADARIAWDELIAYAEKWID